jgi:hypothetical protein
MSRFTVIMWENEDKEHLREIKSGFDTKRQAEDWAVKDREAYCTVGWWEIFDEEDEKYV